MADILIELNGGAGLADNFFGDVDSITPTPHLRNRVRQGELAGGFFNPFLRKGYLAPTTTTKVDVTTDVSPESEFGSVEYDYVNNTVYWADRGNKIYKSDGLNDTSFGLEDEIENFINLRVWDEIHDLQLYELNGEQKIFVVGKGLPTDTGPLINTATLDTSTGWRTIGLHIESESGTKPSVVYTGHDFYASHPFSTVNRTANVVAGDDRVLYLIVSAANTSFSISSATFAGQSLTPVISSAGFSGRPRIRILKLVNPPISNSNVVVDFGDTAPANMSVWTVVVNNANQTNNEGGRTEAESSNFAQHRQAYYDKNGLNLVYIHARDEFTASSDLEEIRTESAGSGETGLFSDNESGYGLQVGYADLPWSTTARKMSWLTTDAQGGFVSKLDSDYGFMRTADNGFAYLFADNAVHKIDGTITGGESGVVTKNVLLLPDYFNIKDAVDYRSRLYMAIHQYGVSTSETDFDNYSGKCGVLVWNRQSTQLGGTDFIEVPGVKEIKKLYASPDGMVKMIVISNAGLTEVRRFGYNDSGGVVFPATKILGMGAYPQYPDGLVIGNGMAIWLGNDGVLYSEEDVEGQEVLAKVNNLAEIKPAGPTQPERAKNIKSGAIFYGSGVETADSGFRRSKQGIYLSYLDGSGVNIKKVYPFDLRTGDNSTQTPHPGNVYTGVEYMPVGSIVDRLRIYNAPIAGTGSDVIATVKLYFNQSTSATMPNGITKTITKDEAKRGYVDFQINKPYIQAVQIEIEWATSEPLGDDTYLPSIATVLFTDTTSISGDNG